MEPLDVPLRAYKNINYHLNIIFIMNQDLNLESIMIVLFLGKSRSPSFKS